MQNLLVLQSLWAMEKAHPNDEDRPLEVKLDQIAAAGFDGFGVAFFDEAAARQAGTYGRAAGMAMEGLSIPNTIDALKPALEIGTEIGLHHLNVQPDFRARSVAEALPVIEGWLRLAEEVEFPIYIETHRNRMTNDLHFTLDLLEALPELRLLADLSHYIVGREFNMPLDGHDRAMLHRVLDQAWAFHGRVASTEQIQVEISYPQHQPWFDLAKELWGYGFASWKTRAPKDAELTFLCELGPQPYAISDRTGRDTTDRWAESLMIRDAARALWAQS